MKKIEKIGERIRAVRLKEGLTQSEFAQKIGISGNRLSEYETKGDPPKSNILASIYRNFDVDATWLLTGEGMMEKNKVPNEPLDKRIKEMEEKVKYLIDRDLNKTEGKVTAVPMYLHSIAAGHPADSTSSIEKHLDLPVYMVKNPADTYAVKARGDSMAGSGIEEGDILIVDGSLEPQHKNIVIASVNGEQTVKKLWIEKGNISLVPSNGNYTPVEITKDMDFRVLGVVTWVIRQTV